MFFCLASFGNIAAQNKTCFLAAKGFPTISET
jgi:hypothetical protein